MTRRIKNPRYGMMVTDATGTWMLIVRRVYPVPTMSDDFLVWLAVQLPVPSASRPLSVLFLDPGAFAEVV